MTPQAEFALLYERHHRALYRYCRSIVRHEEDAQDALQSTMTRAYAALQAKPRDFDLRPWLFRIAHNESVSILRRRRPTIELDAELAALGGVDERAEAQETLRIFRQDLADLPERQRSALVLRELNGLRPSEIAELLETTPGAIKQSLLEARRALARCNEGRETPCFDVQRALMEGDGRVLRGRGLRAHLRSCVACRRFRSDVRMRRPALLPALLSAIQSSGLFAKTAVVAVVAVTATAEVRTLDKAAHPPAPGRPAATATATATATPAGSVAAARTAVPVPTAAGTPAPRRHGASPARRHTKAGAGDRRKAIARGPARAVVPKRTSEHAAAPAPVPTGHDASPEAPKADHVAPGQAKKQEPAAPRSTSTPTPAVETTPPGQAKKDDPPPGLAKQGGTPPGQAKKDDLPPAQAKNDAPPPGQAKKDADTS